jgi:hypothetical protein
MVTRRQIDHGQVAAHRLLSNPETSKIWFCAEFIQRLIRFSWRI